MSVRQKYLIQLTSLYGAVSIKIDKSATHSTTKVYTIHASLTET